MNDTSADVMRVMISSSDILNILLSISDERYDKFDIVKKYISITLKSNVRMLRANIVFDNDLLEVIVNQRKAKNTIFTSMIKYYDSITPKDYDRKNGKYIYHMMYLKYKSIEDVFRYSDTMTVDSKGNVINGRPKRKERYSSSSSSTSKQRDNITSKKDNKNIKENIGELRKIKLKTEHPYKRHGVERDTIYSEGTNMIKPRFISLCLRSMWASMKDSLDYTHRFTLIAEMKCYYDCMIENNHSIEYDENIGIYNNPERFLLELESTAYTLDDFENELKTLNFDKVCNSFNRMLQVNNIICKYVSDSMNNELKMKMSSLFGHSNIEWIYDINEIILRSSMYIVKYTGHEHENTLTSMNDILFKNDIHVNVVIKDTYHDDDDKLVTKKSYVSCIDPVKLLSVSTYQLGMLLEYSAFVKNIHTYISYLHDTKIKVNKYVSMC